MKRTYQTHTHTHTLVLLVTFEMLLCIGTGFDMTASHVFSYVEFLVHAWIFLVAL
jgi:hypothetical protein